MIERDTLTGLILAGGLGRRMSADGRGANKALTSFRGRPMLAHVIERLTPQVGRVVLNVNREPERFASFGLPLLADRIAGHAGPLAGLHAGLSQCTTPWLLSCPCDTPFLPDDLASRLADALQNREAPIAYACTQGQPHPVFALVAARLADDLASFLAAGGRKIDRWYEAQGAVMVEFDDEAAFRNINTPVELARYESQSEPPLS